MYLSHDHFTCTNRYQHVDLLCILTILRIGQTGTLLLHHLRDDMNVIKDITSDGCVPKKWSINTIQESQETVLCAVL